MHILLVRTSRLGQKQRIVGPPERRRWIQILAVHIAGKGSGFAHQPVNHVAVVHPVLVLAAQPLQPQHYLLRVAHLDLLQTDACLHGFADQPGRHRVGVVFNPNRTHATDTDPGPLQRLQTPRRQRPQASQLRGHLRPASDVPHAGQLAQPLFIGRTAGKIPAAT
jgi:hypothetical protein